MMKCIKFVLCIYSQNVKLQFKLSNGICLMIPCSNRDRVKKWPPLFAKFRTFWDIIRAIPSIALYFVPKISQRNETNGQFCPTKKKMRETLISNHRRKKKPLITGNYRYNVVLFSAFLCIFFSSSIVFPFLKHNTHTPQLLHHLYRTMQNKKTKTKQVHHNVSIYRNSSRSQNITSHSCTAAVKISIWNS